MRHESYQLAPVEQNRSGGFSIRATEQRRHRDLSKERLGANPFINPHFGLTSLEERMATGSELSKGGIGPALPYAGCTVFHSGGVGPTTTTTGTDTTPATTETYLVEVCVPLNATLTGASLLNGSAVAGNVTAILYDSNGAPIVQSASTAQSGTAAYQAFAFSEAYRAKGPAKYIIGFQFSSTSARFRTHILGNFGASKKTSETYGTATAITVPTTFTTGQGPIADVY